MAQCYKGLPYEINSENYPFACLLAQFLAARSLERLLIFSLAYLIASLYMAPYMERQHYTKYAYTNVTRFVKTRYNGASKTFSVYNIKKKTYYKHAFHKTLKVPLQRP